MWIEGKGCVYYKQCSLSCMAINVWVVYFWRGKEQATKLDSIILFAIENKMFLFIGLSPSALRPFLINALLAESQCAQD